MLRTRISPFDSVNCHLNAAEHVDEFGLTTFQGTAVLADIRPMPRRKREKQPPPFDGEISGK